METRRSFLTVENLLYLILLGLALALRLLNLGASPLTDVEAREALAVLRMLRGAAEAGLPHSPAYFFFTLFSFLIFDASDAAARLAPALFGAGLVLVPLFFRDWLGRPAALVTSALLAVSAGLLAASRSADGAMLALVGLGVGLGALRRYLAGPSRAWLGISGAALGLGLAGGAAFLTGLFVLGLAALVMALVQPDERETLRYAWAQVRAQGIIFFGALGMTALLVVSAGMTYPAGFAALAESGGAWLRGFVPSAADRLPGVVALFLVAYEPLILVFGLVGAVRAFRRQVRWGQWLFWFGLLALVLTLVYGGRSMFMLIWVVAPFAALAGWALFEIIRDHWVAEEWPQVVVQVAVMGVLLVFAVLGLAGYVENNPPRDLYLYLAIVAILLMLGISALFAVGWSPVSALAGFVIGLASFLLVVSLNASWGLTQLRADSPLELWWAAPSDDGLNRLVQTLRHTSNLAVGDVHDVQITAQAEPDSALDWALRDFTQVTRVSNAKGLDASVITPVVIAPATVENPMLGSNYVGQKFAVQRAWLPVDLSVKDWVAWVLYRRGAVQSEYVIFWVRQDVQLLQK